MYLLNFYLSLIFLCSKYLSRHPSWIWRRVYFIRKVRASRITLSPNASYIFENPNSLRSSAVIWCSFLSPSKKCKTFLVHILERAKAFQSLAAALTNSFVILSSAGMSTACLRPTVRCFWKLWKAEGFIFISPLISELLSCYSECAFSSLGCSWTMGVKLF